MLLSAEEIAAIEHSLPELPLEREERFERDYHLSAYDAEILTSERSLSDYFEEAVQRYGGEAKIVSNWMINDLARLMNDLGKSASELNLRPADLAELLHLLEGGKINAPTAKTVLRRVEETGKTPTAIVEEEGLGLMDDQAALRQLVAQVLEENPAEVASFRAGKESLSGWFLGQVMRRSGGKADPRQARAILLELLAAE